MEQLLDVTAYEFFQEALLRAGAVCYCENEIVTVKEESQNTLILELKTGFKIIATALIYAKGIIPNTSLAAKAGIQILKGVLINYQLQTSIKKLSDNRK